MASEGGGKIRPKKNQTPSKPYERNTSLFGKLKSSVKDLLIPSWLSSASPSNEESGTSGTTKSHGGNIDVSCRERNVNIDRLGWTNPGFQPDKSPKQGSTGNSYVDMITRQQMPGFPLSTLNGEVNQGLSSAPTLVAPNVTVGSPHMHSVPTKNKKSDALFSNFPERFFQNPISSIEKDDKKRRRLSSSLNSDYEVETERNISLNPVMVSTGRIEQSLISSSDDEKHWSHEPLRQGRPLIPPARGKPVFNSLLFGTPSKSEHSSFHESFGDSLFYAGKTQYGGSSAAKRKHLNRSLPYQSSLPLRKKVNVTRPKANLNATTSATAQRILDTLDRMSGSFEDQKSSRNDFGNDSTLSFTPSSYRSVFETSRRPATRPLQLPNRAPPASQLMNTSQIELAYNRDKPVVRSSEGKDSSLSVTQEPIVIAEQDEEANKTSSLSKTVAPSESVGKMKSKKFSQHISSGWESKEVTEYPSLRTDFKLPVSNMNPISLAQFNPIPFSSSTAALKSTDKTPPKFTFSTPKLIENKCHLSSGRGKSTMDEDFTFSSPLQASAVKSVGAEEGSKSSLEPAIGASPGISQGASPSFGAASVRVWEPTVAAKPKAISPGFGGTSSSFKSCTKWGGNQKNDNAGASNPPSQFGVPVASLLKQGSVMDILGGAKSSSSSSNTDPAAKSSPGSSSEGKASSAGGRIDSESGSAFIPLSVLFKKPAGAWNCEACLLQNTSEALKCVACETPKAVSKSAATATKADSSEKSDKVPLSELFKKPAGAWECDSCLVQNDSNVIKCAACETPKPGPKPVSAGPSKQASNTLGAMFKQPEGTWKCDTCLVQNPPTLDKCPCCETPRPGLKKSNSSMSTQASNSFGTMFKKPEGTWKCDTCLVQNPPSLDKCPCCETPRPGGTSSQVSNTLGAMFKKPEGSWKCDTCLVQNPPSLDKCPCCETPRPGGERNSAQVPNTLGPMFKKPEGSWKCDTCLVQNPPALDKCPCCETPRPGGKNNGSESKAVPASSSASQNRPGGGFTFGDPLPTSATASGSGGFKFGDFGQSTSSSVASSNTPGQGSIGQISGSSFTGVGPAPPISGGFKFGDISSSAPKSTGTSAFGVSAPKASAETSSGVVMFGTQSDPVKSSEGSEGKQTSSVSSGFVQPQQTSNVLPSSDGFKFGGSADSSSNKVQGQTFAQSNFTFGATTSSVSSTASKATSLFTFGAPVSTQNQTFGLGVFGGTTSSVGPMVNGGLGSTFEKSNSASTGHVRFGGVDMEAPKAKVALTSKPAIEPATNGGFSLGASASGFTVKGAAPSSGFNMTGSQPGASASGFQFPQPGLTEQPSQSSSSNGFSFTAPSNKNINPADNSNNNNGSITFGSTPNFNFSSDGVNKSGVFMFGNQAAPAAAAPSVFSFGGNTSLPAVPQFNAPTATFDASQNSFSMGHGNTGQRKMKKAVRRLKK